MSKKFLRTLIAVLLICCMLPIPMAFAESATVTGSDVNMRSGPGTNFPVIDCLPKGAAVTVTDRSNPNWYAITYQGVNGYMSSRYLQIGEESSPAQPTPQPNTGNLPDTGTNGHINADGVRFRSGPSSSYSILNTYDKGKELIITDEASGWVACVIDGRAGYVYGLYVTKDSGTSPVVIDQPQPEPTPAGDDEEPVVVEVPEDPTPTAAPTPAPTPAPTAEPTPTPAAGKAGYVNGDYVRFRSGPGSNYSILGTYNKGKELTITGESGGWIACIIDGQSGYMYGQYVKEKETTPASDPTPTPTPTPTPAPSDEQKGYITGNNVRFRSGPSAQSEILGEFFYGNVVTITGEVNGWTAVIYNGRSGYVYSQYVAKGDNGTQPSDPPSPQPGGNVTGQQIVDYAMKFLGYNYVWGGASPDTGFDCSGLVYYVYGQFGYTMNRVAADQARNGVHVDAENMQPGDVLCFYSSESYIGHVGIYIGNNRFIHAANSRSGVIITELSGYYSARGIEVRRIVGN